MRELQQESDFDAAMSAALELRISRALEARPEPEVPADFVARVMGGLPEHPVAVARASGYAKAVSLVCAALLLVAVVGLAPRTGGSVVWLSLQWLLCAQLVGVLVWLRAFSQ